MAKVRVNLANPLELQEIPGVGPQQAETILRFRAEHGPIQDASQLSRVLGGVPISDEMCQRLDFDPSEATAPEAPGG